LIFGALTWLGLGLAALGWIAPWLASGDAADGTVALAGYAMAAEALRATAQNTILSGFGLAILGALQTGFGALDRFFQAILRRSEARADAADADTDAPAVGPSIDAAEIVDRGRLRGRSYVLFADGSVEVETLLGIRRFATFDEAAGFVGR
jgi:prepilin-type processing-associated H-X9-DG protein